MRVERSRTERELAIARVLRPLGAAAMSRDQAKLAGELLGLHWATVYRLRRRFLADPVASAVAPKVRGPKAGTRHLDVQAEKIVSDVLHLWLPRQRELAHPLLDTWTEVRRRCRRSGIASPGRNTVARRLVALRDEQANALAQDPMAEIAPGSFVASLPMEIVQVDHTQADIEVVDEVSRRSIGRPWLTVAIDLASRCVVAIYLAMERPGAATVALLLSRVVIPKAAWIAKVGVDASWPMHGMPKILHLDNAAEFHSRALRSGCQQYGIELMYRPVGSPHFGGHVERMNRTLMERLKGLPGATGNSTVGRKARESADRAALTLHEFEQWLVLEVAERYHHSEHRGLVGSTPAAAWDALLARTPPRQLPGVPEEPMRFLIKFMPMAGRTIQADGLTIFYIRYWHPIFAAWRVSRRKVVVRYHPEDLSRIFVSVDGRNYTEVRYADLRRPPVSLWEQRMACRALRAQSSRQLNESLIFAAIDKQRRIVANSRTQTRVTRRQRRSSHSTTRAQAPAPAVEVDYSRSVDPYPVEIWEEKWPNR